MERAEQFVMLAKSQQKMTQLVGTVETTTEKRPSGLEVSFQRFIVSVENNECKKADLNTMVGSTNKQLSTITPKDKQLIIHLVRPYAIRSIRYLLFSLEGRVYYYTLRLYKEDKIIDEIKLENKGQQEVNFAEPVTVDKITFQGENNYNSCFHLLNLQIHI